MTRRWTIHGLMLLLATFGAWYFLSDWEIDSFMGFFALQFALYAFAIWRVWGRPPDTKASERGLLVGILIVAALMRLIALASPQALSTDAYRYVWDGRVQAALVNPYRYLPADPALAPLRDSVIYPNINRADSAHTIYPPTAQLAFLGIERISDSIFGMKLGMVGFEVSSIACLIALLRSRGLPATRVIAYAWHPLPVWELAGTGHVDAIATAFVLLAFLMAARKKPMATGIALAAATLVKFYPVVCGPALYRRWDWRMPVAFVVTIIALYLPYVSAGTGVLSYLPGYAAEEGLRSGDGLFVWSLLKACLDLPAQAVRYFAPLALGVLAALSLWLQFSPKNRKRDPIELSMLLAGVFTLLVSPHDPWYFVWLVPFLCFRFSWALAWLTAGCTVMYLLPEPTALTAQAWIYGPFLALASMQYAIARRTTPLEIFDADKSQRGLSG